MDRYRKMVEYVPITRRPAFRWPNGGTLAVNVTVLLETWDIIKENAVYDGGPDIIPLPGVPRDIENLPNYTWRDYGPRVGIWRLMDVFSNLGIPVTAALNTDYPDVYPEVIESAKKLNWEFIPHSTEQHEQLIYLAKNPEAERSLIRRAVQSYERVFGRRPRGWLSPSMAGTLNTPHILAEEGFLFTCDLQNDDQPYLLRLGEGRRLVNVPFSSEICDYPIFIRRGNTPDQFYAYMKQEFDVLLEESRTIPRVFAINLHPHVAGRPARARAVHEFLQYVRQQEGVWFAKYEEMAEWTLKLHDGK